MAIESIVAYVGAVKAGAEAINAVKSLLGGARSCVLEIDNNTDFPLIRKATSHAHGGFAKTPPSTIAPHSAAVFGSQSKGGSVMTGTEGTVTYEGVGFTLWVKWNNPYFGSNSCSASVSGASKSAFKVSKACGSGNTNAHMRYELFDTYLRQSEWRWCSKCQGLFFGGTPYLGTGGGKCAAGGMHTNSGSGNYVVVHNASAAPGQADWRWCNRCQGLAFGGTPYMGSAGGACPAGGKHTKEGSGDYTVGVNFPPAAFGQSSWRWCRKCQGIFFGGAPSSGTPGGKCPAGGAHDPTGSGDYKLVIVP